MEKILVSELLARSPHGRKEARSWIFDLCGFTYLFCNSENRRRGLEALLRGHAAARERQICQQHSQLLALSVKPRTHDEPCFRFRDSPSLASGDNLIVCRTDLRHFCSGNSNYTTESLHLTKWLKLALRQLYFVAFFWKKKERKEQWVHFSKSGSDFINVLF